MNYISRVTRFLNSSNTLEGTYDLRQILSFGFHYNHLKKRIPFCLSLSKTTRKNVISCIVTRLNKRAKYGQPGKSENVDYLQHEMNPLDTQSLHFLHQR